MRVLKQKGNIFLEEERMCQNPDLREKSKETKEWICDKKSE